jgi:FkbM family methyltransferase
MNGNPFALKTINYILSHPNCQQQKMRSISRFIGWQIHKRLTNNYQDLQLLPDVRLRCYPDSYSAAAVLYCGLYDRDEMNFLLRYLRPEDSFLDIGANIGVYTLLAASKIKSGFIYSFEVLPKNYARLQENLKLNQFDRVKTYEVAIADFTGEISLNLAEGDSMPFITSNANDKTIKVPTDTLDNLLKDRPLDNLTLAKMDIEGAEILAFQGAKKMLLEQQRPYVWILEINNAVNNFGHQKQDVANLLKDYGYGLYVYDVDTNKLNAVEVDRRQGNNVLAIADSALSFVSDRIGLRI